jgi:uncharacterized protein YgiB involved in biofilm formation
MSVKIRRRSAAVSLSAVVLTGGLMACEPKPAEQPMKVFASASDCATAGQDWNTCNTQSAAAQAEHEKTAPRFANREDCIAQTGGECQENQRLGTGGHSVFLPIMAGFMMGQMMNRGFVGHPVYNGRDGLYSGNTRVYQPDQRNGGGGSGGASNARSLPKQISAPVDSRGEISRSGSARRGGFGRASGFRGGAGE